MSVSYGSLCTGYDGIGMALQLAGVPIEPRWLAENEPAMAKVLAYEHTHVPNVGDIKTAPWSLAPHTDFMSSGDPCQQISIAGRQAGREDPRFLWPWVRIAYREVRPRQILFENVANLAGHDGGRTLAERHAHLREDGYAVRWTILGACAVGAPHHRHRYYALAAHVGPGAPEAIRIGDKQICGAPRSGGRWLLPTPNARDGVPLVPPSRDHAQRRAQDPARSTNLEDAVALLPTPRATDVGTEGRRSSEGWRPQLGQVIHQLLPTPTHADGDRTSTASNARGNGCNGETPPRLLLPGIVVRPEVWGKFAEAVALWEAITGVPAPAPTEPGAKGAPRLSPLLPEWMMGLRPGLLTTHLGRADALKGAGNGVVPLAAAAAYRLLSAQDAGARKGPTATLPWALSRRSWRATTPAGNPSACR